MDRELAGRLVDRLDGIRRSFDDVLVLGERRSEIVDALVEAGRRPQRVVRAGPQRAGGPGPDVVVDEEWLPFAEARFDAVLATGLHWINDLPGMLIQIARCLRPDGLLLAGFPGEETLGELRWALTEAEIEIRGGAGPRVSPFVGLRDAGMLLQRAGLALPVADADRLTIRYREPMRLLAELHAAGEGSVLAERSRGFLRRDVLARAMAIYRERFSDAEGTVAVTVDLIFMLAWKPDPSQQQPLRRGSAQASLAKALGTSEYKGD